MRKFYLFGKGRAKKYGLLQCSGRSHGINPGNGTVGASGIGGSLGGTQSPKQDTQKGQVAAALNYQASADCWN